MSAAGSTGKTTGTATAVVTALASRRLRSRPGRAASHPSMATAPAASRYTYASPGQMKTRHLLRHIQRALARVIGELTPQGIGYTGPEQTDEKRISGSKNRSCLGCHRTYQPFMQGRRPADDQQHRRAERRLRARTFPLVK